MHPTGTQHRLVAAETEAVVVEVGGGLRAFRVGGLEVVDGFTEGELAHFGRGQLLVPFPNRVDGGRYRAPDGSSVQLPLDETARRNAIHGLVRWSPFTRVERAEAWVVLTHTHAPQPGYPWWVRTTVRWEVRPGQLRCRLALRNLDEVRVPAGLGIHPYLRTAPSGNDEAELTVPADSVLTSDERMIPRGREPVAGAFDLRGGRRLRGMVLDHCWTDLHRDADGVVHCSVRTPEATVDWAGGPTVSHVMVYSADGIEPARRRLGLAVEPMTCAPNALVSGDGLRLLAPGEELVLDWRLAVTPRG